MSKIERKTSVNVILVFKEFIKISHRFDIWQSTILKLSYRKKKHELEMKVFNYSQ